MSALNTDIISEGIQEFKERYTANRQAYFSYLKELGELDFFVWHCIRKEKDFSFSKFSASTNIPIATLQHMVERVDKRLSKNGGVTK